MMSKDQKKFYEDLTRQSRCEIDELEAAIQRELDKVRDRITALQHQKEAALQIYDGACTRLGIPNELESEEAVVDRSDNQRSHFPTTQYPPEEA